MALSVCLFSNSLQSVECEAFIFPGSFSANSGKRSQNARLAPLHTLARKYNTPVYVYSADQIVARVRMFARAFQEIPHLVCYSVKANSTLAILKLIDQQDAGFDIVSGGELERVLTLGKKAAHRVVFSGVGKTAVELDLALRSDILIFNVESEAEIELLAERARKLRIQAKIALRVNPDVFAETHPYISTGLREHKFGIDIRKARAVYRAAAKFRYLDPCGVSVHIGSQIRSAEPFGAAISRVVDLVVQLRRDGLNIRYVDAGGGLGIDYHANAGTAGLGGSFDAEAHVHAYAKTLSEPLQQLEGNVTLLLEPGRFLVAQAGLLLTRVLYVKKNGKKTFVITDAGMNDLIRPALYHAHHEIVPIEPRPGRKRLVDVVGPVCETGDFFARDRLLPELRAGDLVAILDAGAYGNSLSSNYNSRPRPAEVLIEGRHTRLIRRRETIQDLIRPELEV
ncbi:Diaminopimelate decarboxylase [Acidisarcina polymorpha]|uniref:Diaminopimelate decarboxylase n=1 Tax=Acidisarcina polymorpha TaxID=2211140 RepID=A0A2Z5G793_9BACT|nr:Diaminopimelate decarboxylase [Acidisarcina polymorpha]